MTDADPRFVEARIHALIDLHLDIAANPRSAAEVIVKFLEINEPDVLTAWLSLHGAADQTAVDAIEREIWERRS